VARAATNGGGMKAARLYEYGGPMRIDDVPTPEPGPGEVLVRIGGAGVCHSDLHIIDGDIPFLGDEPKILGHENAGWVEALGPGVTSFEAGEPVVVFGGWGCGLCRRCLGGEEQLCDTMRWGGVGPSGGYAEHLLVPSARHLVRLGDLDPAEAAPLTDAALTPYRAVKKVAPRLLGGGWVLVIGAGGLGQMAIQFLKLLTPAAVIVADLAADKRTAALALGADTVVDPGAPDVADAIRDATGGEGAAAVVDLVGNGTTLSLAAASLGYKGELVIVGLANGAVPFSFFDWPSESVVTTSTWGTRNELEEVVAHARAGNLELRVERHPLEDINEVFARLAAGRIEGRAVLVP
jgi:propanol-preferring alcohol dehydrogenase